MGDRGNSESSLGLADFARAAGRPSTRSGIGWRGLRGDGRGRMARKRRWLPPPVPGIGLAALAGGALCAAPMVGLDGYLGELAASWRPHVALALSICAAMALAVRARLLAGPSGSVSPASRSTTPSSAATFASSGSRPAPTSAPTTGPFSSTSRPASSTTAASGWRAGDWVASGKDWREFAHVQELIQLFLALPSRVVLETRRGPCRLAWNGHVVHLSFGMIRRYEWH